MSNDYLHDYSDLQSQLFKEKDYIFEKIIEKYFTDINVTGYLSVCVSNDFANQYIEKILLYSEASERSLKGSYLFGASFDIAASI